MEVGEMAVKKVNDWMLFFYIEAAEFNYGSTVLIQDHKAIVFDTMECVANGKRVKDYLQDLGIDHFTVVNTHWHFDHIGGNSLSAEIHCSKTTTLSRPPYPVKEWNRIRN